MQARIPDLRELLADKVRCKEVYGFAFALSLEEGQKNLEAEYAFQLWKLFLVDFKLLDDFCEFLKSKNRTAVSRDLWMMLYDLAMTVKPDLSDYDMDGGAWPVLIDEFVEQQRGMDANC